MASVKAKAYINGKWVAGRGGVFPVHNPATGEEIMKIAECTKEDVQDAIDAASSAFESYKKWTPSQRAALLMKIHDLMDQKKEELATLLTTEQGKPKVEAMGEIQFSLTFLSWFAEETRRMYGETVPTSVKNKRFITVRQPAGVAACITPWNFPVAMIARKVGAALAAGCTAVLKPAEDTPLNSLFFAQLCEEAGVPAGVVNVVTCSRDRVQEVGALLCDSHKVKVVSFTGSTAVGQWLYSRCGPTVKKLALELGGDAPFIVFPSAKLDQAVKDAMFIKFLNCGQVCVSANRVYVHESIHDEFVSKVKQAMMYNIKQGNGLSNTFNQGPLVNKKQHERCTALVRDAVSNGATIEYQAQKGDGDLFFPATILTGVTKKNPIAQQEIFGPVFSVLKFKTEEEVIKCANDTERGLSGYFYTEDIAQAWRVSEAMEVGMAGINAICIDTAETPFGGVKMSGLGKEGSRHALDDFTNDKTICWGNL